MTPTGTMAIRHHEHAIAATDHNDRRSDHQRHHLNRSTHDHTHRPSIFTDALFDTSHLGTF